MTIGDQMVTLASAPMPVALSLPATSGSGTAIYTAGRQLITDISSVVQAVGLDIHLFPTGDDFRVQHVGWCGVGFVATPSPIGPSNIQLAWWSYLNFVDEDMQVVPHLPLATHFFAWNLAIGCVVDFTLNY